MPFEYAWRHIAQFKSEYDVLGYLDQQKKRLVVNSQLETCTLCVPNADRHKMRYILYKCNSSECKKLLSPMLYDRCWWHTRVRTCQVGLESHIDQNADHISLAASPTGGTLSMQMKYKVRIWTDANYKPGQSLNNMIDEFNLTSAEGLLPKVQSFAAHHRRAKLGDTDFMDDMIATACAHRYSTNLSPETPFILGVDWNDDAQPILGGGSPQDPLVIGCSTRTLITSLARAAQYPLHVDATFKLSSFGYPVIVVGVSDGARQFHPAAFFLVSDLTQKQYQRALNATADVFRTLVGSELRVSYIMADADVAERNACEAADFDGEPQYRMCWFHVMQNVKKYCAVLSTSAKRLVYQHMYRMHYSRDAEDFEKRKAAAVDAWATVPECAKVTDHLKKQWLSGRFTEWQCFQSPPGYAKTNNPLETFNADIKREYTNRDLLSLNCLLKRLLAMAKHRSVRAKPFLTEPRPGFEMIRRYKILANEDSFAVTTNHRSSIAFLLGETVDTGVYHVSQRGSLATAAVPVGREPSDKRIEREVAAEVEVQDQPITGWTVDVVTSHCTCRTWIKFGYCVHLIACRESLELPVEGLVRARVKFVNKRGKKGRGRQAQVGVALSRK